MKGRQLYLQEGNLVTHPSVGPGQYGRFLIRDRAGQFTGSFDGAFTAEDVRILISPPQAPRARGFRSGRCGSANPWAARAIRARDGKIIIPASLWHAIAAGDWLGKMVSAALGDPDGLAWARQALRDMKDSPKGGPLSEVLSNIIDGNRNRSIVRRLDDVTQKDIAKSVFQHVSSWRG